MSCELRLWRRLLRCDRINIDVEPHSHPSPIYAAIVPVAATDEDWNRLPDLVDSLSTYGPSVEEIVVLDDGAGQARPLPAAPGDCKITRLPNIRAGRGDGWSGGLCAGLIEGYRYLHDNPSPSRKFILRIDTDALAIAPFAGASPKYCRTTMMWR